MKNSILFVAIALLSLLGTGCKKDKIKGCTNASATNYDSDAQEDDGSCSYSGRYVFWAENLVGAENASVYVDGTFMGNISNNFTSAPACGTTGALTMEKSWSGGTTKVYSYTLDAYDGSTYLGSETANITVTANACTSLNITD